MLKAICGCAKKNKDVDNEDTKNTNVKKEPDGHSKKHAHTHEENGDENIDKRGKSHSSDKKHEHHEKDKHSVKKSISHEDSNSKHTHHSGKQTSKEEKHSKDEKHVNDEKHSKDEKHTEEKHRKEDKDEKHRKSSAKPRSSTKEKPAKKEAKGGKGGKAGKRKKKKGLNEPVRVDVSKPLIWPSTPEVLLEYHKNKPFMTKNEEWSMVELNEYECMVENMEIITIIGKHSKFFEIDPDELWEMFFEQCDDLPTYDDIINWDVWQEFRDNNFPC